MLTDMTLDSEAVNRKLTQLTFSRAKKVDFLDDLASLVEDGMAPRTAVSLIASFSKGAVAALASDIETSIANGNGVADGMDGWLDRELVAIIRAGEKGGVLQESLRSAANALQQSSGLAGAVIKSLIYPAILMLVVYFVLRFVVADQLIPELSSIRPLDEWGAEAQNVAALAMTVKEYGWLIPIVIVALVKALGMFLTNYVGPGREELDKLPVFKQYREIVAGRFLSTLGLLVSNRINFRQALSIIHDNAKGYLKSHIEAMEDKIAEGTSNMAQAMDTGVIADMDIAKLKALGTSRDFDHAIIKVGERSSARAEKTTLATFQVLQYVLMAFAAMTLLYVLSVVYTLPQTLA